MAQLTCFEWKLSHLSPAFCIWHRWRNSRFWAIYFDIRVPNLTCHQHRENSTVLCQQHWQLHQLSASRLRQSPQHHKPQNEVLLPHLWVSLFVAQTWEPIKFIPDFIHRKNLKVHPVTKLDMPPTQGKQTVLCHQHWERKLRKTDADLEPFFHFFLFLEHVDADLESY